MIELDRWLAVGFGLSFYELLLDSRDDRLLDLVSWDTRDRAELGASSLPVQIGLGDMVR